MLVCDSPRGFVNIEAEENDGVLKIRGKFADGTGGLENRTYKLKYIYSVTAIKPGQIELLIFSDGLKLRKDVPQIPLTIMGTAPRPGPNPDPKPKPDPPPVPVSDHVMIEVVHDALNISPDTAIVLNAVATWNEFREKGHDWRIYDKATGEAKGKQAIKDAAEVSLPAMIVRDKVSLKVLRVMPLPKTIDDVKRVLSELTGGV